jgi:hypothetical protein
VRSKWDMSKADVDEEDFRWAGGWASVFGESAEIRFVVSGRYIKISRFISYFKV